MRRFCVCILMCALGVLASLPALRSERPGPTLLSGISGVSTIRPISPKSGQGLPVEQVPFEVPILQGWGGVTLSEASTSDMQTTLQRLNQSGYNAMRIGFGQGITACSSGELGSWSASWLNQTIQIAQKYGTWLVLDYHSYNDLTDLTCEPQWLSFWKGVLSTNWGYGRIVWEPINEPAGAVSLLTTAYQTWITQARTLGDYHWVAIENQISNNGCSFDPLSIVNCYPNVTDPFNRTFLSIHPYLFYNQWQSGAYGSCSAASMSWGNLTAECVANIYNQGMMQAASTLRMPILDTEGGAVYYSCSTVCANPPDAIGIDDASYSNTTLHFIQYLMTLMQSEKMGWLWWEAGEGSCCGALDTWGKLLSFKAVGSPPPSNPPSQTNCANCGLSSPTLISLGILGIAGLTATVAVAIFLRRRHVPTE